MDYVQVRDVGDSKMDSVEKSVLGAVLLDEKLYEQITVLRADDFSLDAHHRIFVRMRELHNAGSPINTITLVEELRSHGELERIGGADYVGSLLFGLPDRPSVAHFVEMIRDDSARRSVAKLAEKMQRQAENPTVPIGAIAGTATELSAAASRSEDQPPRSSEEALALRFSDMYADDLRYVHRWGHWMIWDGTRWVKDDTLHVFDLARRVCRTASAQFDAGEKATAIRLASKATSAAVERLAEADRRHASTVEQWDTDCWLLNTPRGTVDLRTGRLRDHRRSDFISKITAVGPGGDCPIWCGFLDRITGNDPELVSFLQRMVGYSLTGSTREQALFFLYGTGANGKSVLISTISSVLADYARTAPASSFTATANEQHPTDIAGLRGARLVTAVETEDESRWAESRIKSLTGGDKIAARFMRCDFFEFVPEFKLIIAGNHKPSLRSVDEAIRRRLYLIPFTVTIPKEERDPGLAEKLKAERSGILSWAIKGCLEWQRQGLNPPAVVRDATATYMDSEDSIGRWLEDSCAVDKGYWTPVGALFASWQRWCVQTGERVGSLKQFARQLELRGFQRHRTNRAKGFIGIGLRVGSVPDVPGSPIFTVTDTRARTPYMELPGTTGTATGRDQ